MDPTLPGGTPLEETLRALAREDDALGPPARVEAHLRARVRALRQSSGQGRAAAPAAWHTWVTAAAAALLFIMVWRFVPAHPPDRLARFERPAPALVTGFLPLPYAHVPVAQGQIVRMTVPRAALAAFGLDPGGAGDDTVIFADVFVGEDGIARSVRFVDPSIQEDRVQ